MARRTDMPMKKGRRWDAKSCEGCDRVIGGVWGKEGLMRV